MLATDFLDRLGLAGDADERAVKRAYARELKLIDQEADAAGFQLLREAYEAALHWARHKPAHTPSYAPPQVVVVKPALAPSPAPALPELAPAVPPPSPQQQAQEVFAWFQDKAADSVARGAIGDSAEWRKHLQDCIDDERLLNLSVRANFEFLVARLLANGWRSGHEALFVAARQVFGWDKDRRRLLEFGQLGAWLNQAIDEAEMYTHQASGLCSSQADALRRVRQDAEPGTKELLTHGPHLRAMLARFPAWTSVIADTGRIEEWLEAEQAVPTWQRRLRRSAAADPDGGSRFHWWHGLLLLLVLRILFSALSGEPEQTGGFYPPTQPGVAAPLSEKELREEEAYKRAAGDLYMPPGTRRSAQPLPSATPNDLLSQALPPVSAPPKPAPPPGRNLSNAEMQAISDSIDFNSPHIAPGSYRVEFSIELDEGGRIKALKKDSSSGLQLLDIKVEQAIRAAAPFGPDIKRRFGLYFVKTYRQRREAPSETPASPVLADDSTPQESAE